MPDVIDFKSRKKIQGFKEVKTKPTDESYKKQASFFQDIDPSLVYDVIQDEKMLTAFALMLMTLKQLSNDGDVTISIDEMGVMFESANSIETGPISNGIQTNINMLKQAYLFTLNPDGETASPKELADSLKDLLSSLIVYEEGEFEDDTTE